MKMNENIDKIGVNWIFEKNLLSFLDTVVQSTK